jgi:hypothetical protein
VAFAGQQAGGWVEPIQPAPGYRLPSRHAGR